MICTLNVLSGCKEKRATEKGLVQYIANEKNGLTKNEHVGNINIKVVFRPVNLIVQQELRNRHTKNDSVVKLLESQYGKYLYFVISMSRDSNEILSTARTEEERQQEMTDLMFNMSQYVAAVGTSGDTLPLADYVYPRVYGASRSTDMLFAFMKPSDQEKEITITVGDIGIGSGTSRFVFRTDELKHVPRPM